MESLLQVADLAAVERLRTILRASVRTGTEVRGAGQQLVRAEPLGRFDDNVGLQMVSDCTVSKVRCECSKSIHRFALILKTLSMIYKLVQSNTYATKRDLYYNETQLFGSQIILDGIINDICCMLKVPRRCLHILSTSKGCIAGDLCYTEEDGNRVNCACNSTAVLVPSNVDGIKMEKDATFQRLLDDDFCTNLFPCIIVTGKGVPDLNTRLMVRKLWDMLHIPVFALMDADPHGNYCF
ncbi:hypothetical protein scyTo_0009803 [Scyliorhinus torazame]|uniref:DNA topoisomerase (ATP-hydrolyzing) n=1 Tax=Scyliorhinus torazame TaxID=75743 RepID=A0A401NU19_SCYTO|nr:hypothetical protein [Scyliorhinus torazame]